MKTLTAQTPSEISTFWCQFASKTNIIHSRSYSHAYLNRINGQLILLCLLLRLLLCAIQMLSNIKSFSVMNLTYRNYSLSFTSNTIVLINIVANMIIWQEYTARNLSKTKSILKIISCWERLSYLHYSRPLFQSFLVFSSSMNKLVVGSPQTSLVHCLCFPDSPFHDLVALSSKTTKGLGPYIHWRVKME